MSLRFSPSLLRREFPECYAITGRARCSVRDARPVMRKYAAPSQSPFSPIRSRRRALFRRSGSRLQRRNRRYRGTTSTKDCEGLKHGTLRTREFWDDKRVGHERKGPCAKESTEQRHFGAPLEKCRKTSRKSKKENGNVETTHRHTATRYMRCSVEHLGLRVVGFKATVYMLMRNFAC